MTTRPSTTERGYGAAHQLLRKRWAPVVARGGVRCARCHRLIPPDAPWDLGHDDQDRSRYSGPEHSRCNRATEARKAARQGHQAGPGSEDRYSRVW